ncbi:glycosyltransferase family 4 protein [Parafrigoribacterium mesophilum]|uniref:glycosyltransferase family 4 protein n=1 Tax=Parafrigoribacterium mesophilum TaxID=433646 RepID=UPI0031FDE211
MEHKKHRGIRVLIIVQNLPVPLDRRVWLECQALTAQGYSVSVICPKGPGDPPYRQLDGVGIYQYTPAPEAKGLLGFVVEFAYSWIRTAVLSIRVRRQRGFDVIQACNPPDTYWLLALLWRACGVRFVFDHHDLNPELFISRFGQPRTLGARIQYRGLLWLERRTYQVADRAIATNGSYKHIAVTRGNLAPELVTVVRSGPDTRAMRPIYPPTGIREGAEFLLAYLGIMGPQDGVDKVLEVVDELVHRRGRTGVKAVLMGFGDCLEDLRAQSSELSLDDHVIFTGRVGAAKIAEYLSAADLGVCPDLKTPLNDLSTMNKTMEYMAYALPSVAFDLTETRVSGGDTAVYVPSGDIGAFADAVEALMDDPARRVALGRAARERVSTELDWQPQAQAYVGVYDDLFQITPDEGRRSRWPAVSRPAEDYQREGVRYVDLEDADAFDAFIAQRSPTSGAGG